MEAVVEVQKLDASFNPVGHRVQLAGPLAGEDGVWLATDVVGLLDPASEAVSKPLGNRPGSRLVSTRVVERTLTFRVTVEGSGLEWSSRDAAWGSLWDYNEYTGIFVTTEYSGTRFLKARLSSMEVDTEYDPHVNGATDVVMEVVADDPFWYSYNTTDPTALHKTATGTSPVLNFDFRNLMYSGRKGKTYPVIEFWGATGTPVLKIETPTWQQSFYLPKVSNETFTVSTDPMARQIQPDTVWRRANGVRYTARVPLEFETMKISVTGLTGLTKLVGHVSMPFYRAWG